MEGKKILGEEGTVLRGFGAIFSGEQGNKGLNIRGTGEHRQFWGTGNIENQDFVFGEQGHFFEGNRYPPWEGLRLQAHDDLGFL